MADDVTETLPDDQNPQEGQEPQFDTEYVKKLRAENAKYRTERNALSEKVQEFEQERMTKEEQAAQKLKELEERETLLTAKMRAANLKTAVLTNGAGKLASVDAALKLLDSGSIEYDDENNPVGVDAAVAKLLKDYPFLGVQPAATGDKTNPERGGRNTLTLDDVKKMTPAEINSRWDEVSAVMNQK